MYAIVIKGAHKSLIAHEQCMGSPTRRLAPRFLDPFSVVWDTEPGLLLSLVVGERLDWARTHVRLDRVFDMTVEW